jgi:hypothetical protein
MKKMLAKLVLLVILAVPVLGYAGQPGVDEYTGAMVVENPIDNSSLHAKLFSVTITSNALAVGASIQMFVSLATQTVNAYCWIDVVSSSGMAKIDIISQPTVVASGTFVSCLFLNQCLTQVQPKASTYYMGSITGGTNVYSKFIASSSGDKLPSMIVLNDRIAYLIRATNLSNVAVALQLQINWFEK